MLLQAINQELRRLFCERKQHVVKPPIVLSIHSGV